MAKQPAGADSILDRKPDPVWYKWGPYLSERQWGTVREDYSNSGDAWNYFSHDQARSRAYQWGEDGLGGISDYDQFLCFALALWNGKDPILKERLFGLTNSEGNHGEDCKEYYFYLDSTHTHSYMKYLYKYPQAEYPYSKLVQVNGGRDRKQFEYELIDTGVFDEDRYFDVFVEYAKESPEDILIQITVFNRGPDAATVQVLPTLWFRNTWSWSPTPFKPQLRQIEGPLGTSLVEARQVLLGKYYFYCEGNVPLLFTENETNTQRIFGTPNSSPFVKDGINNYIVLGDKGAISPALNGTKVSARYGLVIGPGEKKEIRLRLNTNAPEVLGKAYPDGDGNPFGVHFDEVMSIRKREADALYASVTPPSVSKEAANVMRQALAGMLWSKQYYAYNLNNWLKDHGIDPFTGETSAGTRASVRNLNWSHMVNGDIISMPDKWEYPWYAAWDLAFHTASLGIVDPTFARQQLNLMFRESYLHPSGQLPAYEWNFSDVNPPVHAWATMFNYRMEKQLTGEGDIEDLEYSFQQLMVNFTWWLNRKDRYGNNVFEGGFLGLDNIGVFDRSAQLPMGGYLEQADGTAWMAMFSQNMLEIASELALQKPVYEGMALKFYEHFLRIARAMNRADKGRESMWDEEDGFFYDLLRLPDGTAKRLKVRSMVGLIPLCACTVFPPDILERLPNVAKKVAWITVNQPELTEHIYYLEWPGAVGRYMLALLEPAKLKRVLAKMLDENEFLGPYGIRSLSRYHAEHPYVLNLGGNEFTVKYLPAESDTGMFGGNSNWRGPIWLPVNVLIIRALIHLYQYYGNDFTVECPTGSGRFLNLFEVSQELANRLTSIFLPDEKGRRPVYGSAEKFQTDPYWRDYILFYEYFHGDVGAGLGASHQTGWTGLIARLIQLFGSLTASQLLESGGTGIAIAYNKERPKKDGMAHKAAEKPRKHRSSTSR